MGNFWFISDYSLSSVVWLGWHFKCWVKSFCCCWKFRDCTGQFAISRFSTVNCGTEWSQTFVAKSTWGRFVLSSKWKWQTRLFCILNSQTLRGLWNNMFSGVLRYFIPAERFELEIKVKFYLFTSFFFLKKDAENILIKHAQILFLGHHKKIQKKLTEIFNCRI